MVSVCIYEGTEYTGQAYKGMNPFKVDTFDDCYEEFVAKNKADPTCRFFTFRAFLGGDAGTCMLKHWRGNANPNNDAISGTTKCWTWEEFELFFKDWLLEIYNFSF